MEHGGVLVESGRARRSSADPRPHGGGSCSGTGDSRSNRGAARSESAVPRARCGNSAIAQRRATRQLEGNQRQRSSLIGREVGGWAPVAGPKNPSCRRVLFFGASPARCWFFLARLFFGAATSCAPLHISWPDGRAEGNALTNHRSKFEVRRPSHVIKSGRGNRRSLFCVKHS